MTTSFDGIVAAGSLRNAEIRLTTAIDAAMQAETDLNALRKKALLPDAEKAFYLAAEHRVALASAAAEVKAAQPEIPSWRKPRAEKPATGYVLADPMNALRLIELAGAHP